MTATVRAMLTATGVAGSIMVGITPTANADPVPLPEPPPYVPSGIAAYPGGYSYPYTVLDVGPPAAIDSRGLQITSNADPGQLPAGLPGSALGNNPHGPGALTSANARYGISAGIAPAPSVDSGVIAGGGGPRSGLESLDGRPPASPTAPESAPPTVLPGAGFPILEESHGGRS